jgi:hypothetical protein
VDQYFARLPVNLIRLREVQQRDYRDPADFLTGLRALELGPFGQVDDPLIRRLRHRDLREWREARVAALFCHGYSERIGQKIFFSKGEFEDADCVASWKVGDESHFAPIQIKEVAPNDLNPKATLQAVLHSLTRYAGVNDLTILVHVNQQVKFNLNEVVVPQGINVAALWILACISPDQSKWALWGNFLEKVEMSEFDYPV